VQRPETPSAPDVRAARELAVAVTHIAARPGPQAITLDEARLRGAARVLSNGAPRLRARPRSAKGRFDLDFSYRIAPRTWLNGSLLFTERPGGGYPAVSAEVGALPIPASAVAGLLSLGRRIAEMRGDIVLPPASDMLRSFRARPASVSMTLDIPRDLLKVARNFGQTESGIDEALMLHLYARLLNAHAGPAPVTLAALYGTLFEGAPRNGEDAQAYARAAMIAAAMATVDPRVRRLGERGDRKSPPCGPDPLNVTLLGRADLAKHFSLSAAIAAATDPELGRALGTWKELDDSLPGGSGFSFVDLSADRAGLRLGHAANSPAAGEIGRRLASGHAALLPAHALGFSEGLYETEFEARFHRIDSSRYAEAVARIDRALDTSPLLRVGN
jgi:hypothetical protein